MQLKFSEAKRSRKLNRILECLTGALLGLSLMAALCSALSVSWTVGTMASGGLLDGFANVWNEVADCLGKNNFLILPKFAAETEGYGMALTLVGVVVILISIFLVLSHLRGLLLVYLIPFVGLLVLGEAPASWAGVLFVVALLLAFVVMGGSEGTGLPLLTETAIAALVLAGVMGVWIYVGETTEPQALSDAGEKLLSSVDDVRYGTGTLKNGTLNQLSKRKTEKETALEITMDTPQSMYLRGYIGDTYTGTAWTQMSNQTAYSFRDIQYWLKKRGFTALTQASSVEQLLSKQEQKTNEVTIQVKGADRRNSYLPYELTDSNLAGLVNFADSFEKPTGLTGASSYIAEVTENQTGIWTTQVGRLFSAKDSDERTQYFVNESHYNVFAYEHYTAISQGVKNLLYSQVGTGMIGQKHLEYREAIQKVQNYLAQNYVYTENIQTLSQEKEFLENFTKQKKGCDVHYATMATMLFRYYGIPARYVEGYLVTLDDEKKMEEGEPYDLPESRTHAWTEIYVDGYGWMPIETVPDYKDQMEQADLTKGLEGTATLNRSQNPNTGTKEDMEEEETEQEKTFQWARVLGIAAICVLLLLLLIWFLARYGKRILRELRYRRAFRAKDPGQAVCAYYDYMRENDYPRSERAEALGSFAAFSNGLVQEKDRGTMKDELKRGKQEKKRISKEQRKRSRAQKKEIRKQKKSDSSKAGSDRKPKKRSRIFGSVKRKKKGEK